MKPLVAMLGLALAGCGERVGTGTSDPAANAAAAVSERTASPAVAAAVTPVRIGEAGAAFRACQAAGTPRNLDAAADGALAVRAAPFESAATIAGIPAGARFFVCSRSIDQRWMGVVFDPAGGLSPGCGVSAPVPRRANYTGPCRSGWVASAAVRLVAG